LVKNGLFLGGDSFIEGAVVSFFAVFFGFVGFVGGVFVSAARSFFVSVGIDGFLGIAFTV